MRAYFRNLSIIALVLVGMGSSRMGVISCEAEATIYVIRESDGALRFTNRTPLNGQDATVFSSKTSGGRFYRTSTPIKRADGAIIYGRARSSLRIPSTPEYRIKGPRGRFFSHMYVQPIEEAAGYFGVDPSLVRAVIHAESAFNKFAVSPKGARGLMQLMPSTARELGVRNSFEPEDNIWGGVKYLSQLLQRLGNESLAIAAYNAGEGPVRKYNGIPPYSETQTYVKRVLRLKKQYSLRGHG
jgi:soluble lytic murein transglycosylase-like protein